VRKGVNFSFWDWLYQNMLLIKAKLLPYWEHGYLLGFISKEQAANVLLRNEHASFLLRFSDSLAGAVSIAFAAGVFDLHDPNQTIFLNS
jgi:hypothetical protein